MSHEPREDAAQGDAALPEGQASGLRSRRVEALHARLDDLKSVQADAHLAGDDDRYRRVEARREAIRRELMRRQADRVARDEQARETGEWSFER